MPLDQTHAGRYVVLLCPDQPQEGIKKLIELTGVSIAGSVSGESKKGKSGELAPQCAAVFDSIGVALVRCGLDKQALLESAAAESRSHIMAVEPERTVYALVRRQVSIPTPVAHSLVASHGIDESSSTWGIQVIGAV